MEDNDGLTTFLIAFIMTFIVIMLGIRHAQTLDNIKNNEEIIISNKVYMCKEIIK